ncbi:MAG: hypothetical protein AAFW70_06125 [Cyanobacteria bacterium J06635_10]
MVIPFLYKDAPNARHLTVGFVGVAPAFQAEPRRRSLIQNWYDHGYIEIYSQSGEPITYGRYDANVINWCDIDSTRAPLYETGLSAN